MRNGVLLLYSGLVKSKIIVLLARIAFVYAYPILFYVFFASS